MNVVARLARSRPNISTKTRILSLILDVIEPPIPGKKQPPISEDLQKALGDIERGAEKRIEILRGWKREVEAKSKEEMKPVVGHIELVEKKELAEEEKDDGDGEQDRPRKRRVTQSVESAQEERRKRFMVDQEQRWLELTEGRYGTRSKPTASASLGAPVQTTATAAASSAKETAEEVDLGVEKQGQEEEEDGYGRKYKTTSEDRTDRGAARAKQREEREKKEREKKAMEYAEQQLQQQVEAQQKQVSEEALLAEEEKAVEERRKQMEERQRKRLERKVAEREKQKERKLLRKEKSSEKAKAKDDEEEEEEQMVDDPVKDKDYNPEEDPEVEFEAEDQDIDEEDTFEIEKHVHALNFEEAGEYLVAMNRYMKAFKKIVRRGKEDVKREYKKLIEFVKLMIEKLGVYSPIEAADTEAVLETIIDPQCVAWRRALHGTKTGSSKEIQRVEEKRWKVERMDEEREIDPEAEVKTFADTMQVKIKSERADVIQMIKRYFGHVAKAHEEAGCAARMAQLLVDEVDENTWLQIVANGTRPLITMEVPDMLRQAASMKTERERQQRLEQLKGTPIEEIVRDQNMPCPKPRWKDPKIMSPSAYLVAAVYFFLYNTVDNTKSVSNQAVADLFMVSRSNLHRITSGRKYSGGSTQATRKRATLQEVEEHGEEMVKISKVKPKKKAQKKITVTKVQPKLTNLPFLDQPPAGRTRQSRRKKEEDDDDEPMEH